MELNEQDPNAESQERFRIKLYSIGAHNENHGPALPRCIDDVCAKHIAVEAARRTHIDYIGHLPYSGDKCPLAHVWNQGYQPEEVVVKNIIKHIKNDRELRQRSNVPGHKDFSEAIIYSGHGGNIVIQKHLDEISAQVEVPLKYINPLEGDFKYRHPQRGQITPSHANDCEHSVALFLNLLNERALKKLNEEAKKDPIQVLSQFPVLNGLCGYMLKDIFPGEEYDYFRQTNQKRYKRLEEFFMNSKSQAIFADRQAGEYFINVDIDAVCERILENEKQCFNYKVITKTKDL